MSTQRIFISFSSKDRKVAETLCDALESRGHPCWIACRHIGPGENFQEAIVRAIRQTQIMILVFTENANNSGEIKKELALAGQNNLAVIPVRVEDVIPNDAFSYEFATRQWIDMFGDWERSIHRLTHQIDALLGTRSAETEPAPEAQRTYKPIPTNLPLQETALVGREIELAEIKERVEKSRLVTLVGSGGVGKTRISLQVGTDLANRFPDGVWFLELAPASDPSMVAPLLCGLLNIPLTDNRPSLDAVTGFLRQKMILLILDNCEHLVAAVASLADALLKRCPDVRILASSREALAVTGEATYRMPSLAVPAPRDDITADEAVRFGAVQLFVERAQQALGSYALTDADAPAVAAICHRLDGIALAIELAAPRLKILKPAQLLAKLNDRFRLLTGGSRNALRRQQTLRGLIDWSYDLLSEPERSVMRRLSVFADGWSLDGATAVAADDEIEEWEILDLLSSLVDKSLVVADRSHDEVRYHFLESTRHYAREKLAEAGEEQFRAKFAAYLAAFLKQGEATWQTMSSADWLAIHRPELDNLRAALDWAFGPDGDVATGLELTAYSHTLWRELSIFVEQSRRSQIAAARIDAATPPGIAARIYLQLGTRVTTGTTSTGPALRQAVAAARQAAEPALLASCLALLAGSLPRVPQEGSVSESDELLAEALAVAQPLGRSRALGRVLAYSAIRATLKGDYAAATGCYERSLDIARAIGDVVGALAPLVNLAGLAVETGDFARSVQLGHEAVAAAQAAALRPLEMTAAANLCVALHKTGAFDEAVAMALHTLDLAQPLDEQGMAAVAAVILAGAALRRGQPAIAARLWGWIEIVYTADKSSLMDEDPIMAGDLISGIGAGLPEAERLRLIAAGAAMSMDEAVVLARSVAAQPEG